MTRTLRSIYLDTPEHALKQAGIALRLRRDGRRWIQTVKTARQLHGGLSQAGELESPAPGGRSTSCDPRPRGARAGHAAHQRRGAAAGLRDSDEAHGRRDRAGRRHPRRACGRFRRDPRRGPHAPSSARPRSSWSRAAPASCSTSPRRCFPKAACASRGCPSRRADICWPNKDLSTRRWLRKMPRACARSGAAGRERRPATCCANASTRSRPTWWWWRGSTIRKARTSCASACGGLRSAFSVFGQVLKSPEMQRLSGEARWLGQEVGARARPRRGGQGDRPARGRPACRRAGADGACRRAGRPGGGTARGICVKLIAGASARRRWSLIWSGLRRDARLAGAGGFRADGEARRAGRAARRGGAGRSAGRRRASMRATWKRSMPEQRHELRKELKKLRYAVEFLSPLYPDKRVAPFLKRLKNLQNVFGELNDAATRQGDVLAARSTRRRRAGPARDRLADRGEPGARRAWLGGRQGAVEGPRGHEAVLGLSADRQPPPGRRPRRRSQRRPPRPSSALRDRRHCGRSATRARPCRWPGTRRER